MHVPRARRPARHVARLVKSKRTQSADYVVGRGTGTFLAAACVKDHPNQTSQEAICAGRRLRARKCPRVKPAVVRPNHTASELNVGGFGGFAEATLAQQEKCPTPCTPRCDTPLGRLKSFRSTRHRPHAFAELARTAWVTWASRSLRGARRSMHREPHELNPSPIRSQIATAPVPPLGQLSMPRDPRSFVEPQHGLRRDAEFSTRFAKSLVFANRSPKNSTT